MIGERMDIEVWREYLWYVWIKWVWFDELLLLGIVEEVVTMIDVSAINV